MRQEEARARRLLQTQEKDAHLREMIIRREAEREAMALLKQLLKRCLCAWRESTQDTRVRIYSQRVLNEYRLKRAVLRTWRRLTVQERLARELEAAKQFAQELERKESIADYFHETRIKRNCLLRWQGAIKLSKVSLFPLQFFG
ncbi:hypothetical protein AHF37_06839 [Paragonimus kellicotti]|nr:hypothetical protein AHF37_06839 [Paragonimus kellicotti]